MDVEWRIACGVQDPWLLMFSELLRSICFALQSAMSSASGGLARINPGKMPSAMMEQCIDWMVEVWGQRVLHDHARQGLK